MSQARALGCFLLAAGGSLFLARDFPRSSLEIAALDRWAPRPSFQSVACVSITPRDVEALPRFGVAPGQWPWQRLAHAAILHAAQSLGAKSLHFSLLFRHGFDPATDQAFVAALERARIPVGLACFQGPDPNPLGEGAPTPPALDWPAGWPLAPRHFGPSQGPLPKFRRAASHLGWINLSSAQMKDRRTVPLVLEEEGRLLPSLGLAAYLAAQPQAGAAEVGPLLTSRGDLLVAPVRPPRFRVQDLLAQLRQGTPEESPFFGKHLFVGLEGAPLATPLEFEDGKALAPYQLQALEAAALLEGKTLRPAPAWIGALGVGILAALAASFPAWLGAVTLLGLPLTFGLPALALGKGIFLPMVPLALALAFGLFPLWIEAWLRFQTQRQIRDLERTRAVELSRSLLPRTLPPGIEASLLPARGAAGDGYDWLAFEGVDWLVLFDVSGKGLDAALLAAEFRAAFRSLARSAGDPAELLGAISLSLDEDLSTHTKTITAVLVQITPEGLRLAAAGHPPPLARHSGQEWESLSVRGRPLGSGPRVRWKTTELSPPYPEEILLFSDGWVETLGGRADWEREVSDLEAGQDLNSWVEALNLRRDPVPAPDDRTLLRIRSFSPTKAPAKSEARPD